MCMFSDNLVVLNSQCGLGCFHVVWVNCMSFSSDGCPFVLGVWLPLIWSHCG